MLEGRELEWTPKCKVAFQESKKYLMNPPLLAMPQLGEELFVYPSAIDFSVSVVLMQEQEQEHMQHPIYSVIGAT